MEPTEIAIIGVTLLAFAAVSRRLDSSPLTMPMVFVATGAAMSALNIVEVGAEIEAVGFAWGVNYWYSDGGGLHAQRPDGAREIYKHQCVTIGGRYR